MSRADANAEEDAGSSVDVKSIQTPTGQDEFAAEGHQYVTCASTGFFSDQIQTTCGARRLGGRAVLLPG